MLEHICTCYILFLCAHRLFIPAWVAWRYEPRFQYGFYILYKPIVMWMENKISREKYVYNIYN